MENPEWWLVGLGFLTLPVVIWQAFKTHHAADASRKASEAASSQASQAIKAERPWLLIKISGDGKTHVAFHAHNAGRSPAKIIWRDPFLPAVEVPIGENLPSSPRYPFGFAENGTLVNAIWVGPGETEEIGIFDSFDAFPANARLFVYSAIKYQNTFNDEVHESRFCYRISMGVVMMDGPYGYNQYT